MRPVLLVHGILGQRHLYWNVFRRRLQRDHVRFHEVVLPLGLLGDLRVAAHYLRDRVEEARRSLGAPRVDLVCHSAGGLVARYYLHYLDGHRHVDTLVCLGTPHQGTHFGHLFPFTPLDIRRQSLPGSRFLQEIDRPLPVRIVSLWSPLDGVVIPHHNARLPGGHNIEMPWATHWGFLLRRDVYEAVRDTLGHASPGSAAAPGDAPATVA